MSVLWLDGFDSYGPDGTNGLALASLFSSEGYQIYSTYSFNTLNKISNDTRTGQGFSVSQQSNYFSLPTLVLDLPQTTLIAGFALKYGPMDTHVPFYRFDHIEDNGTHHSQFALAVNTAGQIMLCQSNSQYDPTTFDIVGLSANNTLFPSVWYYVEIKYTLGSPGYCEVRVDNTTVITYSGNTGLHDQSSPSGSRIAAASNINCAVLGALGGAGTQLWLDDYYLLNDMGGLNDFLGDHVIVTAFPATDATPNAWTPSSAGAHFGLLADIEVDTTYVSTDTAAQQELYGLTTLPAQVVGIAAAQLHVRADRDSSGTMSIELQVKGTATTTGSSTLVTSAFTGVDMIMEAGPDGAWDVTSAQNVKIGFTSA